jgi:hypothetical protein
MAPHRPVAAPSNQISAARMYTTVFLQIMLSLGRKHKTYVQAAFAAVSSISIQPRRIHALTLLLTAHCVSSLSYDSIKGFKQC